MRHVTWKAAAAIGILCAGGASCSAEDPAIDYGAEGGANGVFGTGGFGVGGLVGSGGFATGSGGFAAGNGGFAAGSGGFAAGSGGFATGGTAGVGGSGEGGSLASGGAGTGGFANGGFPSDGGVVPTGGVTASGGAGTGGFANGGFPSDGGVVPTGGVTASGGAVSTGGVTASGGTVSTGGVTASGGAVSTGGVTASGGAVSTGGVTASGGAVSTGGVTASGGAIGAGGGPSTGGAVGTGGFPSTGGAVGSGGVASTGGVTGSGGAGTTCPEGLAVLCGMVEAHNAIRAAAPSANPVLPVMEWDPDLAALAQSWADTCPSGHNPNRVVRGQTAGENIFWTSASAPASPAQVVNAWASEGPPRYDITGNTCDGQLHTTTNFGCGHYTQLVWRTTVKVGCAMKTGCTTGLGAQPWVCDYLPAGNVLSGGTTIGKPY